MFDPQHLLSPQCLDDPLPLWWQRVLSCYLSDETEWLRWLALLAYRDDAEAEAIARCAAELIERVRSQRPDMLTALLQEYHLGTWEGCQIMALAEGLVRVPDSTTADALIADKLNAKWRSHIGEGRSLLVSIAGLSLSLAGFLSRQRYSRLWAPTIRSGLRLGFRWLGRQFVQGQTLDQALRRKEPKYVYSYDMLGEAALTAEDATGYLNAYLRAIERVGLGGEGGAVSIKLSALHPRYEAAQSSTVIPQLVERLSLLCESARNQGVMLTLDAEESDRLELSLRIFESVLRSDVCAEWQGLGLAVQAYSKRAPAVLGWLARLAREQNTRISVRLVKGAYWDSEIKWAQQRGLANYPVFTSKAATDLSYLACCRLLLNDPLREWLQPQFATHNAHSIAAILTLSGSDRGYEFQRLLGMGKPLYDFVMHRYQPRVCVYAPVGQHRELLPYLIRRLLENCANSSFVHQLGQHETPLSELTRHPVHALQETASIPLPLEMLPGRRNSSGAAWFAELEGAELQSEIRPFLQSQWRAAPILNGVLKTGGAEEQRFAPYGQNDVIGTVCWSEPNDVEAALAAAERACGFWQQTPVEQRARILDRFANSLEKNRGELIALCQREAGKTIQDSIDEVREAVDFCRYYAQQARRLLEYPISIGHRTWRRSGLGVVLCISPWNFPLAIFLGQVTAALVSGNCVLAKPAQATSLIAARAIQWLLECGLPPGVIQLLPGGGDTVGAALTADSRIAGVAFTGSLQTAQSIQRSLAGRGQGPVPFVAETGGQNAMIVDSSALPEQVVRDVMRSAFASAGQRCSALRVLFVQEDIAERLISLLKGAMAEWRVGDPRDFSTDCGPVIDRVAQRKLQRHIESLGERVLYQAPLAEVWQCGGFIAPTLARISCLDELHEEHFGPVLHVIRYRADELSAVIDSINASGFGLTLGVHSRIESRAEAIARKVRVGNVYINRDQIGAVVGVQPFGGCGLSGTGPKAGGPNYLLRFVREFSDD